MEPLDTKTSLTKSFFWALALSFTIFPYFFLGLRTPLMSPYSWALKESVVGYMVFLPGLRSLQWQLFENGQIWWNSLRSMGLPLLSNEIQAAPLYPLTLLWSWLPDHIFWFFFVCTKIVLGAWASILIGQRVFRFSFKASIIFCLSLSFALYVTRFVNHPWHNAFVAFLWYLLSVHSIVKINLKSLQFWPLTLCIAFYSMMTSGFPSAAAILFLLTLIFIFPYLFKSSIKQIAILAVAHVPAFLLSAPLLFSLFETLSLTSSEFRSNFGLYQIRTPGVFLGMVHRFWNGNPPYEIVHVIRLMPLFLMGWGLYIFWKTRKNWTVVEWSILFTFTFALLKYFPILPPFNGLIGNLPIIRQSHFTIYGFTFFLLPFAYWMAVGTDNLLKTEIKPRVPLVVIFFSILILFLASVIYAITQGAEINPLRCILVLPFILSILFLLIKRNIVISSRFSIVFFLLFLVEGLWTQPSSFLSVSSAYYLERMKGSVDGSSLEKVFNQDFKMQFRLVEQNGLYSKWGFSTADVGATAILPERYRRLRTVLFEVPWKGYMPVDQPKFSYSYPLLASNLYLSKEQAHSSTILDKIEVPGSKPVWIDKTSLTRLTIASRCKSLNNMDEVAKSLTQAENFKLDEVLLEKQLHPTGLDCSTYKAKSDRIKIIEEKGNSFLSEVIEGPALIHLSQLYYPGWEVIDEFSGNGLDIQPANLALSATYLPEKRSYQLRFQYRPKWLKQAQLAVCWGLFLLIALIFGPFIEKLYLLRLSLRTKSAS